eukprot:COSAG01_NODE_5548_length_4191_cov_36.852151_8_plen_99_part_00
MTENMINTLTGLQELPLPEGTQILFGPASNPVMRGNQEPRAWKAPGLIAPKNGLPLAAAPRHPRPAKNALRVSSLVAYTVASLSHMDFSRGTSPWAEP